MSKKPKKSHRPPRRSRYRPTPIPGLGLHPTVLLLNFVVRSAEDNTKTDGLIPHETVDWITGLIRHTYDLPDLDRDRGQGVVLSIIGQFFHPDDYLEHRLAKTHTQGLLNALQGDLQPLAFKPPKLRTSNVPDPADLARGDEKALPLYYKQRFLSICFVGESTELDKLRGDIPAELLDQILSAVWQALDISQESFVMAHPAFVPARQVRKVSEQNAIQWAEQMKQLMKEVAERGAEAQLSIIGPPGPSYTVRPQKRRS